MADDDKKKKDEKKDAKPAKPAPEPAEAAAASHSPLIGIILGVVVLAGAGLGAGMYIVKALAPAPTVKANAAAKGGHGAEGGTAEGEGEAEGGHANASHVGGYLENALEVGPIELKANVTGSGGTRYVTLTVGVWVDKADQPKLNDEPIRRLIQSRMEATLRTYQLEDLQGPNIQERIKKDFGAALERLIGSLLPHKGPYVIEINPTALLTQ